MFMNLQDNSCPLQKFTLLINFQTSTLNKSKRKGFTRPATLSMP